MNKKTSRQLKRSLKRTAQTKIKERSILTRNMLANKTCESCRCGFKAEWSTNKDDVGKIWCNSSLRFRLQHREDIPKENTCRFWQEKRPPASSLLNHFASVQPMAKPKDSIFYMKPIYRSES